MTDSSVSEESAQEGEPPARTRTPVPANLPIDALPNTIRGVSFWTAALLPILYVPVLAWGIDSPLHAAVFVALVAANVVALVVGRSYDAE